MGDSQLQKILVPNKMKNDVHPTKETNTCVIIGKETDSGTEAQFTNVELCDANASCSDERLQTTVSNNSQVHSDFIYCQDLC